jgi:hypothetical protein
MRAPRTRSTKAQPQVSVAPLTMATPALVFIGLTGALYVNIGGRISIGEIAAVLLAGTVLLPVIARIRWARPLILALAALLVGLLLGSLAFDDPLSVVAIAAVNYLVLVISSLTVAVLLIRGSTRSAIAFLASLAIGQILGVLLNPTATALIDPWKFGIGAGVALLVLLAVDGADHSVAARLVAVAGGVGLALYSFYVGSRSLGMFVVLALVFGSGWFARLSRGRRGVGILVLVVVVLGAWLGLLVYDYAAANGWLGASTSTKYFDQIGDFGLLPGARKEIVLLTGAWLSSPLFGWGASGAVPAEVRLGAFEWFTQHGYAINFSTYLHLFGTEDTPLHSVALGAVIQAGVFAVPLVVVVLAVLYTGLNGVATTYTRRAGAFVLIAAMAHFLMSPLGDITRLPIAAGIALAMCVGSHLRGDVNSSHFGNSGRAAAPETDHRSRSNGVARAR